MNQDKTPLLDAINEFINTKPAYFRIPGHRMDKGISSRWTQYTGTGIFAYDVTETPLTDDLHSPEGAIAESQRLLSELYKSDKSYFLVNGSTCGNEAMIMSVAFEGEKIMIARNAHKSAMMGLIISGAVPVYVMPEYIEEWSIQGGITPDEVRKAFTNNPDCRALFMVSPSYYGVCSDLKKIAEICHEFGALLLVDEAHGGHVYFHKKLPVGALDAGADMCVQSFHKITGALTQSSVLHVRYNGINDAAIQRVASNLHMVQSTSPSYLLMTSLDCARYELAINGKQMVDDAIRLAEAAREEINKIRGFKCMDGKISGKADVAALDATRLVISADKLGITGFELEEMLYRDYGVNMELADYHNVLAVVTYANTSEDMNRLVKACTEISNKYQSYKMFDDNNISDNKIINFKLPIQMLTPRQAYFSQSEDIDWQEAAGRISSQQIVPYPPGIPVIYPGELIAQDIWEYVEKMRVEGKHIHGLEEGRIKVLNCHE